MVAGDRVLVDGMTLKRYNLPLAGSESVAVVVATEEGEEPRTVFMDYEGFLELWATLCVAVETLRDAGIAPKELPADRPEAFRCTQTPFGPPGERRQP